MTVDGLEPEARRRVQAAAMKDAMHRNLDQFRAMNPDERQYWLRRLDEQAPAQIQRLIGVGGVVSREHIRELLVSEEAKEVIGEATRIILGEMSARERAELTPLFTKWMRIVQNL